MPQSAQLFHLWYPRPNGGSHLQFLHNGYSIFCSSQAWTLFLSYMSVLFPSSSFSPVQWRTDEGSGGLGKELALRTAVSNSDKLACTSGRVGVIPGGWGSLGGNFLLGFSLERLGTREGRAKKRQDVKAGRLLLTHTADSLQQLCSRKTEERQKESLNRS